MAKNKNNSPADNEEVPGADEASEETTPNESTPPVTTSSKSTGFQFRHNTRGSFKSIVQIDGKKHEMVCKNGIITTTSSALAHHLRGKYSEIR